MTVWGWFHGPPEHSRPRYIVWPAGRGVRIVLRRDGDVLADMRTNADGRTDKPLLEGAAFQTGPMS